MRNRFLVMDIEWAFTKHTQDGPPMKWLRSLLPLCFVGSVACRNPQIVQISPGVYLLSRSDRAGIFGNASKMKADVIREANEFAAKQGKVAIPVTTNESPLWPGHLASFDYQFRLVDKDSPEAKGLTTLGPMPTVAIQKVETKDTTEPRKDVYAELEKLDALRKKGIITDAEFEAEKKKLLERK